MHRPVLRRLLRPQEVYAVHVRDPLHDVRVQDAVLRQREAAVVGVLRVLLQLHGLRGGPVGVM